MYCKKCKKNGAIFDKYCEHCGTKLEHKKIDPIISKKIIKITIILSSAALIVFLGYKTINYLISPEYTAKTYFDAIVNNDIDKIYSYLDTEDSEFVSKKILTDKMNFFENVNHYEITSIKRYQNYNLVKINYTTNKQTKHAYVKLVKTNDILRPYKVVSGKLVTNVTFKVPSGAKITVDDVELKNPKVKDNFDLYTIDSMIKGTYQINIKINDITIDEEIEIIDDSTYTISNINIDDELETALTIKTREELNYMYDSILAGKIFDEIKDYYKSETNKLKSYYNNVKRAMNSNITNIEFIDLEIKKVTYSDNGKLLITYLADQNVTINEETTLRTGYIKIEYDYINNNYEVYNISR